MPRFHVGPVDLAVVVAYVIGVRVVLGWYFVKKTRGGGADAYFLAGRSIRWPVVGLSFYVANLSGGSFVALPGSGYHDGVAVYNYEWLPAILLIAFATFVLPVFRRADVYTAPEYLERRFSRGSRLAFSAFTLLTSVMVDAAASLYAGGTIVRALYPAVPFWLTVAVTSGVAGVYIAAGGLGAVVLNDVLQASMVMGGGILVTVLALQAAPSWEAVRAAAPPDGLHLFRSPADPTMPWPGLFTGVLVIGFYFWCTNQFIIQRALGTRTLEEARWGSLLAGLLKLPNLFILILPGLVARTLYPDLRDPDLVFPTLAFDLLPVGLRGLLLAAVAAAILSSLEAIFNSAATLFTMDFVRTRRPDTSDDALAKMGRLSTLGMMVLAAIWTPQIQRFPTLWQYLQSILSYLTPPVVAVFALGLFWRRATARAAFVTLVVGVPIGAAGFVANELLGLVSIQYLYASGVLFAASVAAVTILSLLGRPPLPEKTEHAWSPAQWRADSRALARTPLYANFRVLALALLGATAAVVFFWR